MLRRFADLARDARVAAKMTLKQVADGLGYSVVYISDIERGNRSAPAPDVARKWAVLLGENEQRFETYARLDKRFVEIPIDHDQEGAPSNEAALALARSWNELDNDAYQEILDLIKRHGDGK